MLIFLALTTYFYFTGTMLGNLAPLLAVPGLIGLGALALVSWRTAGRPRKWSAILLAVLCLAPVSYTHLDVYKRQTLSTMDSCVSGSSPSSSMAVVMPLWWA